MDIASLKQELLLARIQSIKINGKGVVIESDNALFTVKDGDSITTLNPFFEGVIPLFENITEKLNIPCVNLVLNGKLFIMDVVLLPEKYILLFDFTDHYQDSHTLTQEKNEVAIKAHKFAFEKSILLEKEQFKNEFLANLNHEIRNPLNHLIGFLDLLKKTKLEYQQKELVNMVAKTSNQIKKLMDDLLEISRIEKGLVAIKEIPFNMSSFLKDLKKHFETAYRHTQTNFELVLDKDIPPHILGDPTRLYQIFFNLLNHFFTQTPNGTISLKVSIAETNNDKEQAIQFTITSSDTHSLKEDLTEVFETFHDKEVAQIKSEGLSTSLFVAKDFITALHGEVQIETEKERVVSLTMVLPFSLNKSRTPGKTIPKGSGLLLSKRILIIEDNTTDQALFLKLFLNNERGFYIEMATSEEQALTLLKKKKYAAIITKEEINNTSGTSLISAIRENSMKKVSKVPILVASSKNMPKEKQTFLEAGATAFLSKPYTKIELFNLLEKLT